MTKEWKRFSRWAVPHFAPGGMWQRGVSPGGLAPKNPPAMQETPETQVRSLGRKDPLEQEMATHSSPLARESHGQRSLAGYSPWGCKELDMTECACTHTHRVSPDVSETSEMPCHHIWDEMSQRPGCLDATPASRFGIYSSSCWVLRISSWVFHPQWRRVKVFNSDLLVSRAQFTIWRVQFILKIFTYGNT